MASILSRSPITKDTEVDSDSESEIILLEPLDAINQCSDVDLVINIDNRY
jgi:hypothetical protein